MDVRDLFFWSAEARRKVATRKIEAYDAALLPYQKPEVIREEIEGLRGKLQDAEHFAEDAALDKENAELIAKAQAHAAEVMARRRAAGKPAKTARKIPKKARRIR